jgi:hypothetical protein
MSTLPQSVGFGNHSSPLVQPVCVLVGRKLYIVGVSLQPVGGFIFAACDSFLQRLLLHSSIFMHKTRSCVPGAILPVTETLLMRMAEGPIRGGWLGVWRLAAAKREKFPSLHETAGRKPCG